LYPYKDAKTELQEEITGDEVQIVNWEEQMPKTAKKEVEESIQKNQRTKLFWRREYPKELDDRLISNI